MQASALYDPRHAALADQDYDLADVQGDCCCTLMIAKQ